MFVCLFFLLSAVFFVTFALLLTSFCIFSVAFFFDSPFPFLFQHLFRPTKKNVFLVLTFQYIVLSPCHRDLSSSSSLKHKKMQKKSRKKSSTSRINKTTKIENRGSHKRKKISLSLSLSRYLSPLSLSQRPRSLSFSFVSETIDFPKPSPSRRARPSSTGCAPSSPGTAGPTSARPCRRC